MARFDQTRLFFDPEGRAWKVTLSGWSTAMAATSTCGFPFRVMTFSSDDATCSTQVPAFTPHLDNWLNNDLLDCFLDASGS
ncbi:hypothetical protein [Gaopeijia maritima]|uniref:Uncharacterized protein n=1 Tax=Gaopeijia maritima TaxID=3119007 RepID=A0ABU9E9V8_9BACT